MRKKKKKVYTEKGLLSKNTPFIVKESYKTIRTNLLFMMMGRKYKTVLLTSASAQEGKTTNCMNIAITFAQAGYKTLIVDSDMRKPRIHRYFHTTASPGLSERLGGFTNDTCVCSTEHNNLHIIPAGMIPPSPTELLGSQRMSELIKELVMEFDYIFFDTPPINVVTDAAIIASKVDGVLMVVRQGETAAEHVSQAVASLENVGTNLLGFILNGADEKTVLGRRKVDYEYLDKQGD